MEEEDALFDRQTPTSVDVAKFAVITGITQADGSPRVWLNDQMGGKEWLLGEGERFRLSSGTGQIRQILPDGDVILQFDGKVRSLHLGDGLREGKELKQ